MDLTILMPYLNEEANIAFCIEQAQFYLASRNLNGEVLIVDNNSTDRSAEIAATLGARVVPEPCQGYGRALRTGLEQSCWAVIIFGDCDSTYDFGNLDSLYKPLAEGVADFITGDRFGGLMEDGAMSLSHRLGVPFLSWCGRIRFGVSIHDWHCGLRGITAAAAEKCNWETDSMEFATEMIAAIRG